jgi:hypothetical protein
MTESARFTLLKGRDTAPEFGQLLPHAFKVSGGRLDACGLLVVYGRLGTDKRSLALPDHHQALTAELVHGALGRVHRDAELVGQLLVRRELGTRGQLPGLDGRTQAAGDLKVRRTRVIRVQCHATRLVSQLS